MPSEPKRYVVSGRITVSCHTIVWAEDEQEARRKASARDVAGLTIGACDAEAVDAWVVEELDGEPTILDAEESE